MEACATSHHWARELTKLGHEVRLMPAKDVKAYVKRNKNDAADAEAICEAVRRPTMRFVRIESSEQQSQLMLHRARDLLMRQRTQVINALRAHLAEFGITAAQGREGIKELLAIVAQDEGSGLPVEAHASLTILATQLQAVQTMIGSIEKRIVAQHRSNEASKRLETIPGIGVIGATTITAVVTDPKAFRSGRDFAAWIWIVPRQDSTGGNRSWGRSRNRVTNISGAFLLSEPILSCGVCGNSRRSIPGSLSFSLGDRSRSSRSRWPTRWHGSPGLCWPGVGPTGRPNSWQSKKRGSAMGG
jgi:transposase